MIELLKNIPDGLHEVKKVTAKKFLWFSFRKEKVIGYVKIDRNTKTASLLSMSHKDKHTRTSDFPCINIIFDDKKVLSRAINHIGVWQQIQAQTSIERFDATALELIAGLTK